MKRFRYGKIRIVFVFSKCSLLGCPLWLKEKATRPRVAFLIQTIPTYILASNSAFLAWNSSSLTIPCTRSSSSFAIRVGISSADLAV